MDLYLCDDCQVVTYHGDTVKPPFTRAFCDFFILLFFIKRLCYTDRFTEQT